VTSTPTITRTPTATLPPEPVITYFGLTRADDTIIDPVAVTGDGTLIFERFFGSGFSIVVEGRRGGTNAQLDANTLNWNPFSPTTLPGLHILVSRSLGDGSTAVCDDASPQPGGVPGIEPPEFDGSQAVANAVNDLSCRFKDGLGIRRGRDALDACTMFGDGIFRFVAPTTTLQYCGLINEPLLFPEGDTLVRARIRDIAGNISAEHQIVIRVSSP
jgi:hypothetical protein